ATIGSPEVVGSAALHLIVSTRARGSWPGDLVPMCTCLPNRAAVRMLTSGTSRCAVRVRWDLIDSQRHLSFPATLTDLVAEASAGDEPVPQVRHTHCRPVGRLPRSTRAEDPPSRDLVYSPAPHLDDALWNARHKLPRGAGISPDTLSCAGGNVQSSGLTRCRALRLGAHQHAVCAVDQHRIRMLAELCEGLVRIISPRRLPGDGFDAVRQPA